MHVVRDDVGAPRERVHVDGPFLEDIDPRDPHGSTAALAQLLRDGEVALFSRSIDDTRVLYLSENAHCVLGYTAQEVMGTRDFVHDHLHPDDRAWYQEQTTRLAASGGSAVRDFRFRNRDGSYRWIRGYAKVVREPTGKPVLVGHLSDVTEQKELEKGIELQATALRQLADAVLVIDPAGRILDWNQGASDLFGWSAWEVVGRPANEAFGAEWWALQPDVVAEVEAGRTWRGEIDWRRPDGSNVIVSATMVGAEGTCGGRLYVATGHDVTELRTAYRELHALHVQRTQLVDQVVHAEDRERQQIARDVHDDPIQVMTGLQMRLSVLRRHVDDARVAQEVATLEDIVTECIVRMRNLVFELHPRSLGAEEGLAVTLRDMIHNAGEMTGARTRLTYDVDIEPDELVKAVIYRVVLEAVANVRKHARASELEIGVQRRDDGLLVRVRDDGDGFDASDAGDDPGHIGLSSMTERAESAGGWLRLESQPGAGTTVEMWLPTDAASSDIALPTTVPES